MIHMFSCLRIWKCTPVASASLQQVALVALVEQKVQQKEDHPVHTVVHESLLVRAEESKQKGDVSGGRRRPSAGGKLLGM